MSSLEILQGFRGKYYIVGNSTYDSHFPQEWAFNHLPDTGPDMCGNCARYGHIHGAFICYCANCYTHVYNSFTRSGKIYNNSSTRSGFIYSTDTLKEADLWEKCPYMNGVKLEDIGVDEYWKHYCNSIEQDKYEERALEEQRDDDISDMDDT